MENLKHLPIVMHIHEKSSLKPHEMSIEEVCRIMGRCHPGQELPLRADGFECAFIRKEIRGGLGMDSKINPDHYKIGGIETIAYIEAKLTKEQFKGLPCWQCN